MRGLVRADGCDFVNRTGPYRSESYGFYNKSTDILDQVGLAHRRTPPRFRINRREAVAAMLVQVGRKS